MMLLAHKVELRPTKEQAVYLDKACGSRRHCYNQLLAYFKDNKWSKSAAYQYYIKTIRPQFEWYTEVSSRVTRNAIDNLDNAYKHFFRRVKAKQKAGFPQFKKKDVNDSFALRAKAKLRVAKLHFRISNQRQAVLHELSDYLTGHFDRIVIEDLNVKGMVKNHKLARSIIDAGFGYLRTQIQYKAKLRNCKLVIADRFFPSSKTCSNCGQVKTELCLSDRTYHCDCGLNIDRDLNAALNLNAYGVDTLQPT
ncbi:RNA-guided endonuclease TnpB family protein [Candidatus Albibeggiatoa sp. nov. BB20]|uniref:RNA-guided endonuclease InsQ/TnpB family protein n=1 Tax=Candidatus Albibeggiatoa sp. nov. BB20 TaxID=3162723 RepID=UPI003365B06E